MDKIQVKNIFAAVFDKKALDEIVPVFRNHKIKVLGTEGTVKYLKTKNVLAKSAVSGFDFDGRVKSLDRKNFAAILADRSKTGHLAEIKKMKAGLVDAVIVDLYKTSKKDFPETMDIGGQALIRAAIKNYQNVAVAYDAKSIADLAWELKVNKGSTELKFRKKQAQKGLKFIADRCRLEANLRI